MKPEPYELTRLIAVGVSEYADPKKNRGAVKEAVDNFVAQFATAGHVVSTVAPLTGAVQQDDLSSAIADWVSPGDESVGLLLWSGHAEHDVDTGTSPLFLTSDAENARLAVSELGRRLAEARYKRWVVIIDCCYAHTAATWLAGQLKKRTDGTVDGRLAIMTSVDALDEAEAGVFTTALVEVLARGPDERWWSHGDQYLNFDSVMQRLEETLGSEPMHVVGKRRPGECFPNPLWKETSLIEAIDEAHFLPKARGIEVGETGWYFTGRVEPLTRLVRWNQSADCGLFVVTGSAGTGKSAMVARLITLSIERYREVAAREGVIDAAPPGTVPNLGDVDIAYHARGGTVGDLLEFVADGLAIERTRDVKIVADAAERRAASSDRGLTIVVDALDEADTGQGTQMVDQVLSALAARPRVRVIAATRPGVHDWTSISVPSDNIVNLDMERETAQDMTDYAERRLREIRDSPYRDDELRVSVAQGVTEVCLTRNPDDPQAPPIGSFLLARVLTGSLAKEPPVDPESDWTDHLPTTVGAALDADLASYETRHSPETASLIKDLLEALAWDEGAGVPRRLIPAMAYAATGREYEDDDITTLLQLAGGHISEGQSRGWALYRLYHERLREHLRDATIDRVQRGELVDA